MKRPYQWTSPDEQQSLFAEIQRDSADFVPFADPEIEHTIPAYFASMVSNYPNQLALRNGRHSFTYAELDMFSNAIAAAVRVESTRRSTIVALFMEHDIQMIASILGILKAGGLYVPLDPSLAGTLSSVILDDCAPTLVLTDERTHQAAKAMFGGRYRLLNVEAIRGGNNPAKSSPTRSVDLACIIYTSGSTGRPRGVVHTHETLVRSGHLTLLG
jgi:acyl-CoA synthetase (AMP-forming)/AMP-acid ligase II